MTRLVRAADLSVIVTILPTQAWAEAMCEGCQFAHRPAS